MNSARRLRGRFFHLSPFRAQLSGRAQFGSEFRTRRTDCPIAVAYLAYLVRKSRQISDDEGQMRDSDCVPGAVAVICRQATEKTERIPGTFQRALMATQPSADGRADSLPRSGYRSRGSWPAGQRDAGATLTRWFAENSRFQLRGSTTRGFRFTISLSAAIFQQHVDAVLRRGSRP